MNVNSHYIDAPVDRPNDWVMRTDELAFMKIDGRHTGQNLGAALFRTLERYNLQGKAGWVTSDGAAVNRTSTRTMEQAIVVHDESWKAKELVTGKFGSAFRFEPELNRTEPEVQVQGSGIC